MDNLGLLLKLVKAEAEAEEEVNKIIVNHSVLSREENSPKKLRNS